MTVRDFKNEELDKFEDYYMKSPHKDIVSAMLDYTEMIILQEEENHEE